MERNVEVATGESVAFSYELAGLGSRFYAYFIDLTIQVVAFVAVLFFLIWLSGRVPATPGLTGAADRFIRAVAIGVFFFGVFMLFFGYFIAFEWLWNGRTPGKRLLGIRVVRDGGFPLDVISSVVRNVVRMLEFALGFYAISALATLLSPFNRRFGDMAAGTIVVRDRRYERAVLAGAGDERRDPAVVGLSEEQREIVRRYAERRSGLAPAARGRLAASIARNVRPLLAARYDHLDDDDLLVFLAERV